MGYWSVLPTREQVLLDLFPRRKTGPVRIHDLFQNQIPGRNCNRSKAYSPVPETIDIQITNRCGFGCSYCYQDSLPRLKHCNPNLIETVFAGLDTAPYQIAIGGGEPTLHPDLPAFLEFIRGKGTVPNYTTAGFVFKNGIIDATNRYAGGVALTYHAHKGLDWFVQTFRKWKEALEPRVQKNIHLIADIDAAVNLNQLVAAFEKEPGLSPSDINLVLLAYHPDVGRGTYERIVPKSVYMKDLPAVLVAAQKKGVKVAFSEGLLPFFFSRPQLDLNLTYATAQEGRFSCYVDSKGLLSRSSFDPPGDWSDNIYQTRFQDAWTAPKWWGGHTPSGDACYDCKHVKQCSDQGQDTLLFMCAYQEHNK